MADVRATKTGNWSDVTVWNTGSLPQAGDDVYSNTFTVTIDQNVNVLSIRNSSGTSITAGGGFICSTARTITLTGSGVIAGATASINCLTLSHTSGNTVTLTGSVLGGTGASAIGVAVTSTGTTNITGNITGGSNSAGAHGLAITNAATVSITGNIFGSPVVGTSYGVASQTTAATSITISGTLTGASGPAVFSSTTAPFTVTGPFLSSSSGYFPMAISGPVTLSPISNNQMRFRNQANTADVFLYSADVTGGQPAASNVRAGVTYGVGNSLTGTCAIPSASSVAAGVPVGNTVGTASVRPSDLAALIASIVTAAVTRTP